MIKYDFSKMQDREVIPKVIALFGNFPPVLRSSFVIFLNEKLKFFRRKKVNFYQ